MEYVIGIVIAVAFGASTSLAGMDRDRALYPAILIVIASYYSLFAAMAGSTSALVIESVVAVVFVVLAFAGFRSTLWLTVAGLAGHGIFDFVHARLIHNPGVPDFWQGLCLVVDVVLAIYLAWLISRNRIRSRMT